MLHEKPLVFKGMIVPNHTIDVHGCVKRKGKPRATPVNNCGYKVVTLLGTTTTLHRLMYENWIGKIDPGKVVDHIDGNRLNNSRFNLRLASFRANQANKIPGRGWDLKNGKYHARIYIDGQKVQLGSYDTAEEASAAYLAAKQRVADSLEIELIYLNQRDRPFGLA